MKDEAKIPETYLENINMINSATNFSNLFLKSNFNITKNDNSKFDYSYFLKLDLPSPEEFELN